MDAYKLLQCVQCGFEYDEAWWPNDSKTVNGLISGTSYEFSYVPTSDIAGRFTAVVTYGFASGMHPSQAIVTLLQLEGAGLIAKESNQRWYAGPLTTDDLRNHFRHSQKRGFFQALGGAHEKHTGFEVRQHLLEQVAAVLRGHYADYYFSIPQGLLQAAGRRDGHRYGLSRKEQFIDPAG